MWYIYIHFTLCYNTDWIANTEIVLGTNNYIVFKSLNIIYFTSIIQALNELINVFLKGVDVGVLWSNLVEETVKPGKNNRTWMGDHYPAIEP